MDYNLQGVSARMHEHASAVEDTLSERIEGSNPHWFFVRDINKEPINVYTIYFYTFF